MTKMIRQMNVQRGWISMSGMFTRHFPASWNNVTTRASLERITRMSSRRKNYGIKGG